MTIASLGLGSAPALAGLDDDNYDGNIFALYAGNGSIVPPKFSLAQSLKQDKPTLLGFFMSMTSRDSKRFSSVISQLQGALWPKFANFVAVALPTLSLLKITTNPQSPDITLEGAVPQTVLFDREHSVILNEVGQVPYEKLDDKMREIFDLLPRTESVELRRRPINEVSGELVAE